MSIPHRLKLILVASAALLLGACAAGPLPRPEPTAAQPALIAATAERNSGREAADLALALVGTPYRYGGADPAQGFDCSGLVHYVYRQLGRAVPRRAQDQFRVADKIGLQQLSAGDLMFFQDEAKLAHVGIYVGDGLFVHAPATGRIVSVASLSSTYYQEHLVGVGRLL
jgi:cell wall-associated NlpC family hydrolase